MHDIHTITVRGCCGLLLLTLLAACDRGSRVAAIEDEWTFLEDYCHDCHNAAEYAGDLALDSLSPADLAAHPETWEKVSRKLRGDLMPPPGSARPARDRADRFIAALEAAVDAGAAGPRAGHVPIHRLNRDEYALAVSDLLAVSIDPAEVLPTEMEVDGFNNIAAALSISPAFLEQYVAVARQVARLAVGEAEPKLASAYYPPPDYEQDGHVDGLPLGTRGGMRFEHRFPADGIYRMSVTDLDVGLYPRSLETEHTLVILVDRREVFRGRLGGPEDLALVNRGGAPARAEIMARFTNIPVPVSAGVHEVAVTFVERARVATDEAIFGFTPYGGFNYAGQMRAPRLIGGVELRGPFEASGVADTASRRRLFICQPETVAEEAACAERITANLARRAFRRPVSAAELGRIMQFYAAARADGLGFDAAVERNVVAVLASPEFLFRIVEPGAAGSAAEPLAAPGEVFALDDLELATRLAFFLWSQGPDDALLALAMNGQLSAPGVMAGEVRRMLADPRAHNLVSNFALRWLNLDDLNAVDPDSQLFPDFDEPLRRDIATEVQLFLASVLLEERNINELLSADYTFLNERLALHYGIDSVKGAQFRRVTLADSVRHGLLGKAAVLLRTSYGDRTSPVLRGAWVLEKLLGTPPTPPPPNVETDLSTPAGEVPRTIRARLESHRESPSCNSCHGVIDPWGLALENFTVTGQWRDRDTAADAPIDARTVLPDGTAISGPDSLRAALERRDDQFALALTEKLMMYALGRELEYHDMPQVRDIVRNAATRDYRLSAIIEGIVMSDAFRLQVASEG